MGENFNIVAICNSKGLLLVFLLFSAKFFILLLVSLLVESTLLYQNRPCIFRLFNY